jgi:Helix-turn-helix domain
VIVLGDEHNGMSEFVTRKDAARLLRVNVRTIDRYANQGALRRYIRVTRIVYKREEVEALGKPVPIMPPSQAGGKRHNRVM